MSYDCFDALHRLVNSKFHPWDDGLQISVVLKVLPTSTPYPGSHHPSDTVVRNSPGAPKAKLCVRTGDLSKAAHGIRP